MFYRECERLASEHPAISALIEKVDSLLHLYGSTGCFGLRYREPTLEKRRAKLMEYSCLSLSPG